MYSNIGDTQTEPCNYKFQMSINIQRKQKIHVISRAKRPIDTEPVTVLNVKISFCPPADQFSFAQNSKS